MSSKRNSQNLLTNVFRPTYVYDGCGFRASVVATNITVMDAATVRAGILAIGDEGGNIYVGCNAGVIYTPDSANRNNVALGIGAAQGIDNVSNSVFIGSNAGRFLMDANDTTIIGTNDTVVGTSNVIIGSRDFVYGNNNVIIGSDLSTNESYKLNIGNLILGDISLGGSLVFNANVVINGRLQSTGVDVSAIGTANIIVPGYIRNSAVFGINMDISQGRFVFTGPDESRVGDVSFYQGRVTAPNGIRGTGFDLSSSLYVQSNVTVGGDISASGVLVSASNASNRIGGVLLSNGLIRNGSGTSNAPSYTFTSDPSAGMYLIGSNRVGFSTAGSNRVTISGEYVGISTIAPITRFQVNPRITVVSARTIDACSAMIIHPKPTSTTALNDPVPAMYLGRQGTSGQAYGSLAGFYLSRWENAGGSSVGSRTRMDLTLTHDQFDDISVMTLRSDGRVGIGTYAPTTALGVVGDISATATVFSSNFVGNPAASNSIGGVTLNSNAISYSGTITGTTDNTSNKIGGVTLSSNAISYSGTITGTTDNTSNKIGGVILSNYKTVVGNPADTNIKANSEIGGGYTSSGTDGGRSYPSISFQYGGSGGGGFRHFIRSRHSTTVESNSIDFFVNTSSTSTTSSVPGTGNVNSLSVEGNRVAVFGGISSAYSGNYLDVNGSVYVSSNLCAGSGTAAAPAYTFTSDSNSGVYSIGTGQVGFSTGGSNRMVISNGNVGIGMTNPRKILDISSGTTDNGINVTAPNAQVNVKDPATTDPFQMYQNNLNQGFYSPNTLPIHFAQGGANRMTISNAKVGIGTTAPFSPLHVEGGAITVQQLGNITANTDTAMIVEGSSNVGMYIQKGSNNNNCGVSFKTLANTTFAERMRIDANTGQIGVGIVAPARALDVSGSFGVQTAITSVGGANYLEMSDISAGVPTKRIGLGIYNPATGTNAGGDFVINTYNDSGTFIDAPFMVKRSNGFVGVGTVTPGYKVDVAATAGTAAINTNTWSRTTASVCYHGVATGRSTDMVIFSTTNAIDSNLVTIGSNNGTYFTINKTGLYAITYALNGSTNGGWQSWIDASTTVGRSTNPGGTYNGVLGFGSGLNGNGSAVVSVTTVLPSNSGIYYKCGATSGTGIAGLCNSTTRLYITFLGEAPAVTGVPY